MVGDKCRPREIDAVEIQVCGSCSRDEPSYADVEGEKENEAELENLNERLAYCFWSDTWSEKPTRFQ